MAELRQLVLRIATIAIAVACGFVTGTYTSRLEANLPTPWVGVWERMSAGVYMLWIAVLAMTLLRRSSSAARGARRVTERAA